MDKKLQMQKKTPPRPTSERLAQTLEALNDPALAEMIQRARAGYYDDFKTTIATPQIFLYQDLVTHGYLDLAQRVVDGDFESTREEADAWFQREGRKLIKGLDK